MFNGFERLVQNGVLVIAYRAKLTNGPLCLWKNALWDGDFLLT